MESFELAVILSDSPEHLSDLTPCRPIVRGNESQNLASASCGGCTRQLLISLQP